MSRTRGRGNGEGSLYQVTGGWRGYVWVTGPDGIRRRKYIKAITYEEARQKWLKLRNAATAGPVASNVPKLAEFLTYWLREIVQPNLAPKTYEQYEMFTRLHIVPYLGSKRLDKLTARDVRQWLNRLQQVCQCCTQGKDARRREAKRRCCAIGQCCHQVLSPRACRGARDTLRAALSYAITEDELITRNPAAMVRLPSSRPRKIKAWSVAEACRFLESARTDHDPLYTAYVLMLVLGLRLGEVLGLPWGNVSLDTNELDVSWQLQRTGRRLHHRMTKTPGSDSTIPLPAICATALKLQAERQEAWQAKIGEAWQDSGLAVTTRYGTPVEPRNFLRSFGTRCRKAGVRYIKPHGMRRTCGSLLAALDVHPRVAMRILRHSKIAVTMEIYTDVPDDLTRDALRRLGEQFGS
ncbi:MAG TPA: site-specific integrase [Streptosporangiaceae bacterium]|nr:site-specific integrase [Streptosporangiaceae bacterium]